ncbi:FkbM family methyltransferase [Sporomusa termitida]|uniref:Methyltransferase, FkbM family n=1 Tax=Sporomusa termitida TaxID=2377 RepID=A0A517DX67_9FIRM|nr:FkbM family methyltransferase [Sporomusa termitida]QDR81952.1 methyltransferase, FkbM family [Sporomusa termitida]
MDKFSKKISAIQTEVASVPYESRAHLRLGTIRNLNYISQWEYLPENIDSNRLIILYGAGNFGEAAAIFLFSIGVKVSAFVDNKKAGKVFNKCPDISIPIISFNQLKEDYKNAYVAITVSEAKFYHEIKLSLDESKIKYYDIIGYYLVNGLKKSYTLFDDDLSKVQILDSLKYLTSYSRYYEHYFDERLVSLLTDHEVFVDAGVFDGETTFDFVRHVGGQYKHIYGFEANKRIFEKYRDSLLKIHDITLENLGLWCCDSELPFGEGADSASSFVTEYYEKSGLQPVTSLDKYFEGKPNDELPTFIKMDIEGAEYEALLGAKGTIQKVHPKLAICVYHKTEHFWMIPELIKEFDSSYTFFLRHYSPDDVREYVLYAI